MADTQPIFTRRITVLFVAAMGGLGGPVKRLASLMGNMPSVHRVLVKPYSKLLDGRMRELGWIDEHISVRRSAQRSYFGSLLLAWHIFARAASRKQPIDLIHANGIVEFALSWPAALLLRKPVVTWVGNYESPTLVKRFSFVFQSVSKRTLWNAVSSTAADVIADCGLAERHAVRIVTNIIDPFDVAPSGKRLGAEKAPRLRIGYLQVAKWVKGFDLLPKVIKQLSDVHDRITFVIYGKKNNAPGWKELAEFSSDILEVRPRTAAVGDIYADCDIVFSPSRRESFNRVVAEALATGTPVVASDLTPVREVVGDAGLLFPVGNVIAAADCLRRMICDGDLRAQMGQVGKARSQAWLPGPISSEFLAQYDSLAGRCPRR